MATPTYEEFCEDPECQQCTRALHLSEGCEWPEDPRLWLCCSCMTILAERLLLRIEAEGYCAHFRYHGSFPDNTPEPTRERLREEVQALAPYATGCAPRATVQGWLRQRLAESGISLRDDPMAFVHNNWPEET